MRVTTVPPLGLGHFTPLVCAGALFQRVGNGSAAVRAGPSGRASVDCGIEFEMEVVCMRREVVPGAGIPSAVADAGQRSPSRASLSTAGKAA
jgi:hypothetical protein